jgi:hypothetical protein
MDISALDAKYEAQKIAFAPVVFQAVRAALNLGVLETIREKRTGINVEGIAEKTGVSLYGVEVLLELLENVGVVKSEDGLYEITKVGFFLLRDTLTRVNFDFTNDVCYKGLYDLDLSIKSGKPEGLKAFGEWDTIYEALSQLPKDVQKSWFNFDHYYSDTSFAKALPIVFSDNPNMIFDVGGNTGKFSKQCLEFNENVNITMVDLPGQLDMAKENFKSHPSTERLGYYEMNLLNQDSKFEGKADVVWMSQFLDCFSKGEIVSILARVKTALNTGGSIYIMETFCDRQKYPASEFSLLCTSLYFTSIANGNSRMYNLDPFVECVELAGLRVVEQFDEIGVSHSILKCQLS